MNEVKEYLESLLDDFNGNIIDLQNELEEVNIQIKEDSKFLELLKHENDDHFSEFSPRNVNYKNDEKIKELQSSIELKSEEKKNLEIYIEQVQEKIDELELMIGKIEIYMTDYDISDNNNSIDESSQDDIASEKVDDDIKSKLEMIISFLPSDPMRAKTELSHLKNSL